MKTCCRCKQAKPFEDFNRRGESGWQASCRQCQREHYLANAAVHKSHVRANTVRYIERNRQYVLDYLRTHPCVDCGEADPVVLEFDHVRGEKTMHVGDLLRRGGGLARLVTEIEKCDVRCANCHRRKTAERHGGWFKAA